MKILKITNPKFRQPQNQIKKLNIKIQIKKNFMIISKEKRKEYQKMIIPLKLKF